jgi:hypothetical protein
MFSHQAPGSNYKTLFFRLSPGSESQHSVSTRVKSGDKKSRPVSTGDLDRFYDADHSKEFNAIIEEGEGNDKSAG